ncbi:MAG: universal stress protein [Desulfobacterales bacterium CG2_30_60_27]|nr:MAG: universal stress protein [Desulfobacterales bacterium CG2_30_60_27]
MQDVKHILTPVDFSENAGKVLQTAVYYAGKLGAKLTVVFVVQSFEDYSGFFVPHIPIAQFEAEMLASAQKKMTTFLAENLAPDVAHDSVVLLGDIAEEILNFAKTKAVDLVIMGTHGYKGLEKVLFGSVAAKVVKLSNCPVLTVNPYR